MAISSSSLELLWGWEWVQSAECYNDENQRSARPSFLYSRPRQRLKSFGLKRQDQYQDLWYTVLVFETKSALGLKRHSRPLYVKTNDESLADLW